MTAVPPFQPASEPVRPPSRLVTIARIVVLLLVVALSILIFIFRDQAQHFGEFGYPGIFLISLLANATILLPAPGVAVVFAMGSVFSPPLVALAAAAGATVGEISAYAAGFGGQVIIERSAPYARILPWMRKYGGVTTLVLAAVPNPFFDIAGMAAGALRIPLLSFLFWCLLGKSIKMLFFAYTGAYSIEWLSRIAG